MGQDLYQSHLDCSSPLPGIIWDNQCDVSQPTFQTFHVPEQDIASEQMYLILTDLIDKRVAYAGSKLYDHRIIKQYPVSYTHLDVYKRQMWYKTTYPFCYQTLYIIFSKVIRM